MCDSCISMIFLSQCRLFRIVDAIDRKPCTVIFGGYQCGAKRPLTPHCLPLGDNMQ